MLTGLKELVAVMTSLKSFGLILSIGESVLQYQSIVVDCMDSMSRLVVNLPANTPIAATESALESDIRVAVHRQEPGSFLSEIGHHELNLAIVGEDSLNDDLLQQILGMLVDTGCLLIIKQAEQKKVNYTLPSDGGKQLNLEFATVFVKADSQRPRTRKGGRRSRNPAAV